MIDWWWELVWGRGMKEMSGADKGKGKTGQIHALMGFTKEKERIPAYLQREQ